MGRWLSLPPLSGPALRASHTSFQWAQRKRALEICHPLHHRRKIYKPGLKKAIINCIIADAMEEA
jgi:hypothetical protein